MTLLRTLGLGSALALTAFTSAGAAFPTGTCKTTCYNSTTQKTTHVLWSSTKEECCSGMVNNCPPGYDPLLYTYTTGAGFTDVCDP